MAREKDQHLLENILSGFLNDKGLYITVHPSAVLRWSQVPMNAVEFVTIETSVYPPPNKDNHFFIFLFFDCVAYLKYDVFDTFVQDDSCIVVPISRLTKLNL